MVEGRTLREIAETAGLRVETVKARWKAGARTITQLTRPLGRGSGAAGDGPARQALVCVEVPDEDIEVVDAHTRDRAGLIRQLIREWALATAKREQPRRPGPTRREP